MFSRMIVAFLILLFSNSVQAAPVKDARPNPFPAPEIGGEGKYDVTEGNIRALLDESRGRAKVEDTGGPAAGHQTPETYLGAARGARHALEPGEGKNSYTFAKSLAPDHWTLSGSWKRYPEYIETQKAGAALRLRFRGGKVFLVMGSTTGKPVKARILHNGTPVANHGGADAKTGIVTVDDHRLYELLNRRVPRIDNEAGLIDIQALGPGLQAYVFTFGG